MGDRIGFYVLPTGAKVGTRGHRIGDLSFDSKKDRTTFVRGLAMLTQYPVAELFGPDGVGSLPAKECAALLGAVRTALSSGSESTLSSAISAEVVALDSGALEGKLDALCELLERARKDGGLLTTIVE